MKYSEVEFESNRRSFLKKGALTAGLALVGGGLFGAREDRSSRRI